MSPQITSLSSLQQMSTIKCPLRRYNFKNFLLINSNSWSNKTVHWTISLSAFLFFPVGLHMYHIQANARCRFIYGRRKLSMSPPPKPLWMDAISQGQHSSLGNFSISHGSSPLSKSIKFVSTYIHNAVLWH